MNKTLVIKLGSKCNAKCSYCHCSPSLVYELNEDLIGYINANDFSLIKFSGGEPLLYLDVIKKIVSSVKAEQTFLLVTNGSLLDDEVVEYFNQHRFIVIVSYDGKNGVREIPVSWDKFKKLKCKGTSVTVYQDNINFDVLDNSFEDLSDYLGYDLSYAPSFIHQTTFNGNEDKADKETARLFIKQFAKRLEKALIYFTKDKEVVYTVDTWGILYHAVKWFLIPGQAVKGVRCCRGNYITVTLDGRFMSCAYLPHYVGDIYDGVDFEMVEKELCSPRCRSCALFSVCKNFCHASVSDLECYIFRNLYRHFMKLLEKYNVSAQELKDAFKYNQTM